MSEPPHELRQATANLSLAAATHHRERLQMELTALMLAHDVVVIQEAGAARQIVEAAAEAASMTVWFGDGKPGQASTPIAVTRRAKHIHFDAHRLTRQGKDIGPGAGPDHAKAKWLMVALFVLDGEAYASGGLHQFASLQNRLRMLAGLLLSRRANKAMKTYRARRRCTLSGDMNRSWASRVYWRFRRWLRSSQKLLGPVDTGPHHSPIDDQWGERGMRPMAHKAIRSVSDHHWYSVLWRAVGA